MAASMRMNDVVSGGGSTARGFESIADAIMYRWSVERDTWVSTIEVEQARDYLERSGMAVTTTTDGRYVVAGDTADTLGAARLVLLGLRHLSAVRRQSRS
jgi:hypothetical protein